MNNNFSLNNEETLVLFQLEEKDHNQTIKETNIIDVQNKVLLLIILKHPLRKLKKELLVQVEVWKYLFSFYF
jgi:hypothetical protein